MGDKKEPLFDSQFHICIENSKQNNYFTEKLIDCFVTKTIPIYWGCPNLHKFFDLSGIIIANSLDEIIEKCNSLTPETYEKMKEGIEKNFELAQQYVDIRGNLKSKIEEILLSTV